MDRFKFLVIFFIFLSKVVLDDVNRFKFGYFFHFPLQGGHAGHVRVLHLLPHRSAEVGRARPSIQLPHQIPIKQVVDC